MTLTGTPDGSRSAQRVARAATQIMCQKHRSGKLNQLPKTIKFDQCGFGSTAKPNFRYRLDLTFTLIRLLLICGLVSMIWICYDFRLLASCLHDKPHLCSKGLCKRLASNNLKKRAWTTHTSARKCTGPIYMSASHAAMLTRSPTCKLAADQQQRQLCLLE